MSKGKKAATKPSPEDAVRKVIEAQPGATTEGLAQAAGIARSTAGKVLARLAEAGDVDRHAGGHEGRKRLPDRWTAKGAELPAAYARHVDDDKPGAATGTPKPSPEGGTAPAGKTAGAAPSKPARKGAGKAPSKPAGTQPAGEGTSATAGTPDRLRAFGLDPLVIGYLEKNSGPHGPAAVAKALSRSSGAVANCLKRLADAKKIRQVGDKPLRYDKLAA
jgi:hypothetical protein